VIINIDTSPSDYIDQRPHSSAIHNKF